MALVKYNNNSISAVTAAASIPSGSMVLIKSQTASSSASISFVNGASGVVLDGTYSTYIFKFINIHGSANADPTFNLSTDGGSNYNVTKTSTTFVALHAENDGEASLAYINSLDLAQSTAFQSLNFDLDSGADSGFSGSLHLFGPSSTTFVKHFIGVNNGIKDDISASNCFVAGYGNTTSAINAIQFKMATGNIDTGTIKLYGLKES